MSFFRRKAEPQIPPAPSRGGLDPDAARNELLGGGSRSANSSPRPPMGRAPASYGDEDDRGGGRRTLQKPGGPQQPPPLGASRSATGLRDKYNRNAPVGDAYSRGRNVDADRAELFAGASDRQGRESGGRRQFDDGEDEEEDVEAIKTKTRFVKQESVNSTRNALRIAREAEETARNTLGRLGDQSEKLANTERHLDVSRGHAYRAEDQTGELKQLNRSIFRPVIVFNKDGKRAAQEAKLQARYDQDVADRERTAAELKESQNRLGRAALFGSRNRDGPPEGDESEQLSGPRGRYGGRNDSARAEQRKRYQFEATASDDEMENEIDDNLDELAGITANLKGLAIASGKEVDEQIKRIDRMDGKAGKLDGHISNVTRKLDKV